MTWLARTMVIMGMVGLTLMAACGPDPPGDAGGTADTGASTSPAADDEVTDRSPSTIEPTEPSPASDPNNVGTRADGTTPPVERTITVVDVYGHDTAYTQGLEWIDDGRWAGHLLESAGQYGESRLRLWDPTADPDTPPRPVLEAELSDELFAEGATVVGGRAWQLTWQAGRGFVYDLDTFEPVDEFDYDGEGWGLCLLDDVLVRSDGSNRLYFHETDGFEVTSSVPVTADGEPVQALNELECVADDAGGYRVWANIYQSNTIVAIDPDTGLVTDVVDASSLVPPGFDGDTDRVLNGIAHQPDTGRFWLTGKRWPVLYEVELR